MSKDYDYDFIQASLKTQEDPENIFKGQDPFNKDWAVLKEYSGLDQNFKRRTTRTVSKVYGYSDVEPTSTYLQNAGAVPMGQDGTGSKQISTGSVYRNGYGLFDVITPPYNLYELASYYDTSFANHAAIDAKVENVVGLGYRFDITDRTMLKFENNGDEGAVDRARNRIERMKLQMRDWLESLNDDDSFTITMEKIYTD
jgi:hypothetical protein